MGKIFLKKNPKTNKQFLKKTIVKIIELFSSWFAVKSGEFVEIMLESYQNDSFSKNSVLMKAGREMTIPAPENS